MRPVKIGTLTPSDTSTVWFNPGAFTSTGAAVAPLQTSTLDNLAHIVTLTAPVQATLAGIAFTIVGTDAAGNSQTEVIAAGPASGATVNSTQFFLTVETIQPSATMGGLLLSVGLLAEAIGYWVNLENTMSAPMVMVNVTGTINYTVLQTPANIFDEVGTVYTDLGVAIPNMSAVTAQVLANGGESCRAVMLRVNSFTAGATITAYINNSGGGY
jgi:hypothetical protein